MHGNPVSIMRRVAALLHGRKYCITFAQLKKGKMEHLQCMAMRTVKVSDSRCLVSAWSRQHGRLTFAMPAGKSREAARRRALTSPMTLFEGFANVNIAHEVQTIRSITPMFVAPANIAATPMAIFLAEILDLLLRRSEPDQALTDYLFDAARMLPTLQGTPLAQFHILFLMHLSAFAGIEPDFATYATGFVFDLREGIFRASPPLHSSFIDSNDSRIMAALASMRPGSKKIRLDRNSRNRALDIIIEYYSLHHTALNSLKSLDVLRQMC